MPGKLLSGSDCNSSLTVVFSWQNLNETRFVLSLPERYFHGHEFLLLTGASFSPNSVSPILEGNTTWKFSRLKIQLRKTCKQCAVVDFGVFFFLLERILTFLPHSQQEKTFLSFSFIFYLPFYLLTWNVKHAGELIASVCRFQSHDNLSFSLFARWDELAEQKMKIIPFIIFNFPTCLKELQVQNLGSSIIIANKS